MQGVDISAIRLIQPLFKPYPLYQKYDADRRHESGFLLTSHLPGMRETTCAIRASLESADIAIVRKSAHLDLEKISSKHF